MTSQIRATGAADALWSDPKAAADRRVADLMSRLTLREKLGQLGALWLGVTPDGQVAPHQSELADGVDVEELLSHGLGQITRAFGTNPIDAGEGAVALARLQEHVVASNRLGIPALVHEECLAGFTTWGATAYPVPLSWGATFDPALIERMAQRIGASMRAVGVHQGLAPVLDVTRDPRWGRTEETIGEDPYLVGTIATAYVRGLEGAGIVATLKHFAGYSASRGARNLAPVHMGPREFADVILPPFEMAIREGGVRSVMHSYADVDGIPAAADERLLTTLLRDTWGFDGTVVADYFGVGFLKLLHGVAGTWGEAAGLALRAGVDVELPSTRAYGEPLMDEIAAGRVDEALVDRALERVLRQKLELGLLDGDWSPIPDGWDDAGLAAPHGRVDLDSAEDRALARTVAEQSVVLLRNDGVLPLRRPARIAVVGPTADDPMTMLGCYSFPSHVGVHHPELPLGVDIRTVLAGLREEFPDAEVTHVAGCGIDDDATDGIPAAVEAARAADVVIVSVGDRAGLFGLGTSGEGCDAPDLRLPGRQQDLVEAILDQATPTVVLSMSGRPYALGTAPQRAAAILQSFFPGEVGGPAIARVLSGAVAPSGRLPVSIPTGPGAQPWTYLGAKLAQRSEVSDLDPTPAYPFGAGLGYTTFAWSDLEVGATEFAVDGETTVAVRVTNTGARAGVEVVQLYLHDPVASVVRPVRRLVGYVRVPLEAGATRRVTFTVPADVSSFTGRDGVRIVEPGALQLQFGASSGDIRLTAEVTVTGAPRAVDHRRRLHCDPIVD
jgi:beta-xylosidase